MPYKDPQVKRQYDRTYQVKHPRRLSEARHKWVNKNRERLNAYARRYYAENRSKNQQKRRAWRREYYRNHYKVDTNFRLTRVLSARLSEKLKCKKSASAVKLLGCSLESFKLYLETRFHVGMTWENYGSKWHIDHIVPCALFDLSKPEHQKICFHFSNLRPMWATQNKRRGCRGHHQLGLGV